MEGCLAQASGPADRKTGWGRGREQRLSALAVSVMVPLSKALGSIMDEDCALSRQLIGNTGNVYMQDTVFSPV